MFNPTNSLNTNRNANFLLYSNLLYLISPGKDYTNLSNYYFSSLHFKKKKQKVQASFLTSHY